MTGRRQLFLLASLALSFALIAGLIKLGNVDIHTVLQQLKGLHWSAFSELVLLTGVHVYLSNQKWRAVDGVLCQRSDSAPSHCTAFAITSLGVVLGQVLPIGVGMSGARTLGTYMHGRAFQRGAVATLFEQSFDILIVAFLVIASAITKFCHGGAAIWIVSAIAFSVCAVLMAGPFIRLFRWAAVSCVASTSVPGGVQRAFRKVSELQYSRILSSRLASRLTILSAIRFFIQVLMAGVVADAIGMNIPLWHLAAAIPFVVIASAIPVTPGALGVNELSYAAALHLFGTPFAIGAQWALLNRFLLFASCVVVAACAGTMWLIEKSISLRERDAIQPH